MNKKIGLFLGVLILSSFLIASVSAAFYYDARQGMSDLINVAVDFSEPLLAVLLGGDSWTGYLLFEKLILFLLIASIVYLSISKIAPFKDNTAVVWIITLAIPLLSVRWIDFNWLNAIIVQYQVLGVVLTSILPFVIYFLFIEGMDYGVIRKVGWILFIIIYFGIWSTASSDTYAQYYMWTIVLSFILLLFDGTIHRYYMWEKIKASGKNSVEEAARAIRRKMEDAHDDARRHIITADQHRNIMNDLNKQLKELYTHSF